MRRTNFLARLGGVEHTAFIRIGSEIVKAFAAQAGNSYSAGPGPQVLDLGSFGKVLPRRISGTCALHQRKLRTAIMRARQIALLPYVTD